MVEGKRRRFSATAVASSRFAVARSHAGSNLSVHLRVSPRMRALITTAKTRLSCSADAHVQFDVPPDSASDIVRQGGSAGDYQWSGCSTQREPDQCDLESRAGRLVVAVR